MSTEHNQDYIKDIRNSGGEIYVVGGAVRNYLYNYFHSTEIPIKDFDYLVRLLDKNTILTILQKYGKIKEIGVSFGIIILNHNSENYEFALPRKEISTGHGYKDFIIQSDENLKIEEDFARRDATINAIGFPIHSLMDLELLDIRINKKPLFDKFIDPFDGITDIKNKIWKCVGDPTRRFIEEPNRIMRAFRQSVELNLIIEPLTLNAIKLNCNLIKEMIPKSNVRLFDELLKMLSINDCIKYLSIMNEFGILNILGIEDPNLNFKFENTSLLIKFASLIKCHKIQNIDKWLNQQQISATKYLNPLSNKIIININKYFFEMTTIDSLYDFLKILANISRSYTNDYFTITKHIIEYLYNNNNITMNKYNNLLIFLEKSIKYPIDINNLDIDGVILMNSPFVYKGHQITQIKKMLQDKIFKNELINKREILINYLKNNVDFL